MKVLKRNQIIISVIALMLITVGYMNYSSNIRNTLEMGTLMDSEQMAGIGDAKLVNSNNVVENNNIDENGNVVENNNIDENGNVVENTNIAEDGSVVENSNIAENGSVAEKGNIVENGNMVENNNEQSNNNQISNEASETSAQAFSSEYFVSSKIERDKMYSQMLETYQKLAESETTPNEQKAISTQEITNINNLKNSIMISENLIKNLGFDNVVIFVNNNSVSVIIKADKLEEADVAQIQNIVCREIGVDVEKIHISLK